ncbi:failed axon connections [Plakobranchus ocellatus]|uniref:Failed axon connections n=1 Tax=Plakobranchus ocellatus TaxID=259542 RepID=A0AAV4BNJ2_9GAST|nr:failed axon connections [Plakobranchus ocellatus]
MDSVKHSLQPLTSFASSHPYAISVAAAAAASISIYFVSFTIIKQAKIPYVVSLPDSSFNFTIIRLAKIPYVACKDFVPSREGKIPWISYNDEEIPDSQFSIEYLNEKLQVDLNHRLSEEERAIAHAFRVLVDEYQFWAHVHFRLSDPNDPILVDHIPSWLQRHGIKRLYEKYMHAQGMGRHRDQEIHKIFMHNFQMLENYLGDKPFLMGEEPTEVDCSVFGLVGQYIWSPPGSVDPHMVKERFPRLYQLCHRMKERAFPDWDQCLRK